MSSKSLQVCYCGWSNVTTYQGLRVHQGKKGCTPKGMKIPESEQFRFSYMPTVTYMGPPIKVDEPPIDIFTPPVKSYGDQNTWINIFEEALRKDSAPIHSTPIKTQPFLMSLTLGSQASPALRETNNSPFQTPQHSYPTTNKVCRALDFNPGPQQIQQVGHVWNSPTTTAQDTLLQIKEEEKVREREAQRLLKPFLMPLTQTFGSQASPAVSETNNSPFQTPHHAYRTATTVFQALDFNTGPQQIQQVGHVWNSPTTPAQDKLLQIKEEEKEREREAQRLLKPFLMPLTQTFGSQSSPAVSETNNSPFQTPHHAYRTATTVSQALDFNTGPQQIQQVGHVLNIPTTTAQDTLLQIKEEEKEREREAQRLLKARQDSIRAELQQKIQLREQKITEVRSSVTSSTDSLDAEWLEIRNVFSEVMRVVEYAMRRALQPLEERRQRIEREAQDLFQTLQNEIDKLRETIDELDQNPDLQVSPLRGVDESRDWRNVTVDGSFSTGTLRSTTSDMMEEIQQKLENLSSVELKRVATFAVDVKLDPTTAHSYLVVSPDGKKVRDGDQDQKVPAAPGRFDMFGSILGLNRLTSGKSYWEVEVTRKTGWDLGVARCDASRKGTLSLTPDNGYWVTVHYEDEKYAALAAPPVSLSLTVKPQKVGVFVDYDEGLVSFYDVMARSHIYSFTRCSFGGAISPYFSPHLDQNGKNSEPLIISAKIAKK